MNPEANINLEPSARPVNYPRMVQPRFGLLALPLSF